jgi:hypothetical protein
MDHALTQGVQTWKGAKRQKQGGPHGYRGSRHSHRNQPLLRGPPIHARQDARRGGMVVHASMDMGIQDVGAHGWAKFGHRTTSHLPNILCGTIPSMFLFQALIPTDPTLRKTMINLLIQGSQ